MVFPLKFWAGFILHESIYDSEMECSSPSGFTVKDLQTKKNFLLFFFFKWQEQLTRTYNTTKYYRGLINVKLWLGLVIYYYPPSRPLCPRIGFVSLICLITALFLDSTRLYAASTRLLFPLDAYRSYQEGTVAAAIVSTYSSSMAITEKRRQSNRTAHQIPLFF